MELGLGQHLFNKDQKEMGRACSGGGGRVGVGGAAFWTLAVAFNSPGNRGGTSHHRNSVAQVPLPQGSNLGFWGGRETP